MKRDDFATHGKEKRSLVVTRKKSYDPLIDCKEKLPSLTNVVNALENVETELILSSAVPKPKIDSVKAIITNTTQKTKRCKKY